MRNHNEHNSRDLLLERNKRITFKHHRTTTNDKSKSPLDTGDLLESSLKKKPNPRLWWIITFNQKTNYTALNISSMVQIVLCLKNTPQHFSIPFFTFAFRAAEVGTVADATRTPPRGKDRK